MGIIANHTIATVAHEKNLNPSYFKPQQFILKLMSLSKPPQIPVKYQQHIPQDSPHGEPLLHHKAVLQDLTALPHRTYLT